MTDLNASSARVGPLTRTEIARAALDLVDELGVHDFSMRRLADALGVTTMAVYHHFRNKAEILQAAADQVWIEVALTVPQLDDPIEDIIQSMLVIRRAFAAHVEVTTFAFASPTTEDALHVTTLAIVQRFERAGFRGPDVAHAYNAIATYTLGSALLFAQRAILDRAIKHPVSDLASFAPNGLAIPPDSAEAYHEVRAAIDSDPDFTRFERGLRDIMTGLVTTYLSS
jgi:AcrR family transcriptional regulator